jgi:2-keto-4-pentenoate hydratase/2-oxohepta-3-ene-1,7-dioic acid hydratase in catechol pathway
MRLANLDGRAVVVIDPVGGFAVDVASASRDRFGPDIMDVLNEWAEFRDWVSATDLSRCVRVPVLREDLGPPVPLPRQVFAFGLNYVERASEGGLSEVQTPVVFTKFPSCLTGPYAEVALPTATVDWEVELVVVISALAWRVRRDDAFEHVAGLMIGQDLSERAAQFRPPVPQFSLAKSAPGFGPTGPWLVTLEELGELDRLELRCWVNNEPQQSGTVAQMMVPVPELIARLSHQVVLYPGDLIFTGTPGGVGHHRQPPRYLRPGDHLTSTITGLGRQEVTFR